jgi:hypothetical protein
MALTKLQKKLRQEAVEIAEIAGVDFWNIEKQKHWTTEWRTTAFRIAIAHLVVAEVINGYTMIDETLTDYLCRYYFKKPDSPKFIYWKQKKFRVFVHFMLDEMYLLKKMQMVHAIRPLPKDVRATIGRVNAIRNAMAHSFFPENRKEHMQIGKVLYSGMDIRTPPGLQQFSDDWRTANSYLRKRVYRAWKP